jgi:hypothetical protein
MLVPVGVELVAGAGFATAVLEAGADWLRDVVRPRRSRRCGRPGSPDLLIQNSMPALLVRHGRDPDQVEKLRALARGLLITRSRRADRKLDDVVAEADRRSASSPACSSRSTRHHQADLGRGERSVAIELDEPFVRARGLAAIPG